MHLRGLSQGARPHCSGSVPRELGFSGAGEWEAVAGRGGGRQGHSTGALQQPFGEWLELEASPGSG